MLYPDLTELKAGLLTRLLRGSVFCGTASVGHWPDVGSLKALPTFEEPDSKCCTVCGMHFFLKEVENTPSIVLYPVSKWSSEEKLSLIWKACQYMLSAAKRCLIIKLVSGRKHVTLWSFSLWDSHIVDHHRQSCTFIKAVCIYDYKE